MDPGGPAVAGLRGIVTKVARRLGLAEPAPDPLSFRPLLEPFPDAARIDSADLHPWDHPFLTAAHIRRFRTYSEAIWDAAVAHDRTRSEPLDVAFTVNMAQSAYLWAKIAKSFGASPTVYLHPGDNTALSRPEWEEFDGEYPDVFDGPGFLKTHPITPDVPVRVVPMDNRGILDDVFLFRQGNRTPLYRQLAASPGLRIEPFLGQPAIHPYFAWAEALSHHEVVMAPSVPIPAYLSGRPYCAFVVGGDLQNDAGRGDAYGAAIGLAFACARFFVIGNPHILAHCRRLGLTNAVYLPYPINDDIYCPGEGRARREWIDRTGGDTFFLSTARIDKAVKGNAEELWQALGEVCRTRPGVRFVFLAWGHSAAELRERIAGHPDLKDRFLFLPPVGKKRLIDYYRSCDAVIDQFVYGYYGGTGLEAAACGKPVVMRIRPEHYEPLYHGDIAPVWNATTPQEAAAGVAALADSAQLRVDRGRQMREWLLRTHGKDVAGRRLVAILRLTADGARVPVGLDNPLTEPLTDAEERYHAACRTVRSVSSTP
jgi:glycosyltransferase involved in cell wall biosynthesis